jgi:hypothetical protein
MFALPELLLIGSIPPAVSSSRRAFDQEADIQKRQAVLSESLLQTVDIP